MIAVKAHLADTLENFNAEAQWKHEHDVWLNDYFNETDQRIIFFWNDFDDFNTLKVSTASAPKFYDNKLSNGEDIKAVDYQVAYFIKTVFDVQITEANLKDSVDMKYIQSDPLEDLLEKMNTDYVKQLLQENDWPEGVKKEFIANLHKFMQYLNESTYAAKGQTYLYIPDEDLSDIEASAKDKDLLQRLETNVIYWTR